MIKMLKNYKTKLVGLVMIMMFMCSVIPTSSAVEQRHAATNEILVTKSLPEIVDILSDNATEREKAKEILTDPHSLYGYFTKTLGCNLTLANFEKLNNVLETQTNSEDYGIFVAYQADPNIVVSYKGREGTAKELYESVPHLQDMFKKYETSVKNFDQLDAYNQWLWLNTQDVNSDSVKELYDNADEDLQSQMLNESYGSFNKIMGLQDKSLGWMVDNANQVKIDGQEAVYNFNHKSAFRYDNPKPPVSDTSDPSDINKSTQTLIDEYNDTVHVLDELVCVAAILMGTPIGLLIIAVACLALGAIVSATGIGAAVGALILEVGDALLIISIIMLTLDSVAFLAWIAIVGSMETYYADLLKDRGIDVNDYDWGVDTPWQHGA
jgi:hypothetical protein